MSDRLSFDEAMMPPPTPGSGGGRMSFAEAMGGMGGSTAPAKPQSIWGRIVGDNGADRWEAIKQGTGAVVEGAGDLFGLVANPANATINFATGSNLSTDLGRTLREATGLPEGRTPGERVVNEIVAGGTGGITGSGLATWLSKAATAAPGVARSVLSEIGMTPAVDVIGGMAAGGAAQTAQEMELPAWAQIAVGAGAGLGGGYGAIKLRSAMEARGRSTAHMSDEELVQGSLDSTVDTGMSPDEVNAVLRDAGTAPDQFSSPDVAARMAARVEAARERPPVAMDQPARDLQGMVDSGVADPSWTPQPAPRVIPEDVTLQAAPEGLIRSDEPGAAMGVRQQRDLDAGTMAEAQARSAGDPVVDEILNSGLSPRAKVATLWDRLRATEGQPPEPTAPWRMSAPEGGTIDGFYSGRTKPNAGETTLGPAENLAARPSPTNAQREAGTNYEAPMQTGRSDRLFRDVADDPAGQPGYWEGRARQMGDEAFAKAQSDLEAEWTARAEREAEAARSRQSSGEQQGARQQDPGDRFNKYGQKPHRDDPAGDWRMTDDGMIADKDGQPVAFRNPREAAGFAAKNNLGGDFELGIWATNSKRVVLRRRPNSEYGKPRGADWKPADPVEPPAGRSADPSPRLIEQFRGNEPPPAAPDPPPAPEPAPAAPSGTFNRRRPADPGREPARPRGFVGFIREKLDIESKKDGIRTLIDAEDAIDKGVPREYIYNSDRTLKDGRRVPGSIKVGMARTFGTNKGSMTTKQQRLRTLDMDDIDAERWGLKVGEDGRIDPEDIGDLIRRDIEKEGSALDRNDPRYEAWAEYNRKVDEQDEFFARYGEDGSSLPDSDLDAIDARIDAEQAEWDAMLRASDDPEMAAWGDDKFDPADFPDDGGPYDDPFETGNNREYQGEGRPGSEAGARAEDTRPPEPAPVEREAGGTGNQDGELRGQSDAFGERAGDERAALERAGEGRLKGDRAQKAPGSDGGLFDPDGGKQDDMFRPRRPDGETRFYRAGQTTSGNRVIEFVHPMGDGEPLRGTVVIRPDGEAYIGNMGVQGAENKFGVRALAAIRDNFLEAYPEITRFGGERISGSRASDRPEISVAANRPQRAGGDLDADTRTRPIVERLRTHLDAIATGSTNRRFRDLAARLNSVLGDDATIAFGREHMLSPKGSLGEADVDGMRAFVRNRGDQETLLHEAVHLATMSRYGEAFDQLAPNDVGAGPARELADLRGEAQRHWDKVGRRLPPREAADVRYALDHPDEFLSMALTNPATQSFLERGSLWGKVVNGVRKLLGLEPNFTPLLDRVLKAGTDLLDAARQDRPRYDPDMPRQGRRMQRPDTEIDAAKPGRQGWARIAELGTIAKDAGSILDGVRSTFGDPKKAATGATDRLKQFGEATLYSADGQLRSIAGRLNAPTIEKIADMFHAEAGRASGTARTYHEAVEFEANGRLNGMHQVLEPFIGDEASLTRIRRLLAEPNRTHAAKPAEHAAAAKVRDQLKGILEYRRDAGENIGEVASGYFPRVLDPSAVAKNLTGFLRSAERLYRSVGIENPREAAQAWAQRIQDTYAGLDGGLDHMKAVAPNSAKAREFGKEADTILADFYDKDAFKTLALYIRGGVRRAEEVRRFGAKGRAGSPERAAWEKEHGSKTQWDVLMGQVKDELRSAGNDASGIPDVVLRLRDHNLGTRYGPAHPALSALHAWNHLGVMDRALVSSIGDMAMGFVRAGPKYGFDHFRTTAGEFGRKLVNADPSDARRWSEAIGATNDLHTSDLLQSRIDAGDHGATYHQIMDRFYRGTGLQQFTEAGRVAATKTGKHFLRDLAHDMASSSARTRARAGRYLSELGAADPEKFAASLRKGAPSIEDLHKPGFASDYVTALNRYVNQSVLMPTRAERPSWAAHPVGGLFFSLQSYSYGFWKNALQRSVKDAYAGLKEGDVVPALNRAFGLTVLAGTTYLVDTYLRPFIWGSRYDFGDETPSQALMRTADRAGFFGPGSQFVNMVHGFKYQRDPVSSLAGPIVGRIGEGVNAMGRLAVENSPNTNTAERNAAGQVYDLMIEPAADFAATRYLNGAARAVGIQATGVRGTNGILPSDREAFVSGVAGEKPE
jgi:hypothetical protein